MEMKPELAAAFNRQITLEMESSLAYLQMSAWFDAKSLSGMASWMRVQAEEERSHALKFFDYVLERGNEVTLEAIPGPDASALSNPVEVFTVALAQERKVSAAIADQYDAASTARDAASFPLLQWFLEEQVEEESTVSEIVDQLAMIGDNGAALLLLDRELGSRIATPEA